MIVTNDTGYVLTISEVAELLHVHTNTLRIWTNQGLIKAYRIGKRGDRRFAPEDVFRFMETSDKVRPVNQT